METLNVGLERVANEYVVFLAADDMLDATALEKCSAIMNRNPRAPICGVLARYVDEDKRNLPTPALFDFGAEARYLPPKECLRWLYRHGALFGGNGAMYRTEPLRQRGGFASDLRSFCDGFKIQELALSDGACVVPEVLASWRQRDTTYAAVNRIDPAAALAIADAVDVLLRHDRSPFPPEYARRLRGRLRFAAAQAAVCCVPGDWAVLRHALTAYPGVVAGIAALFARLAGPRAAIAVLAVLLRPFDIPGRVASQQNIEFLTPFCERATLEINVMTSQHWTKMIESRRPLTELRLEELWRYRHLVKIFVRRDFVAAYKQTILGPFWMVFPPLMSTLVFTVIFGHVAQISTNGIPHAGFLHVGHHDAGAISAPV